MLTVYRVEIKAKGQNESVSRQTLHTTSVDVFEPASPLHAHCKRVK